MLLSISTSTRLLQSLFECYSPLVSFLFVSVDRLFYCNDKSISKRLCKCRKVSSSQSGEVYKNLLIISQFFCATLGCPLSLGVNSPGRELGKQLSDDGLGMCPEGKLWMIEFN